jgi:DNA-directed RNA polymerase specialized sigma subunit
MSVFEMVQEDLAEDIVWPDPMADAPRPPYVNLAVSKEQARSLYLDELSQITEAIKGLQTRRPEVVRLAKANGATWEEIGEALGTSRQAACRTYSELAEA